MKKEFKLAIAVFFGIIVTIVINITTNDNRKNIVAIGDGLSQGITSFKMIGVSYNDYLEEYYHKKNCLKNYNRDFSWQYLTIAELNNKLDKNEKGQKSQICFKQILAKADVIILNIGMDELVGCIQRNSLNEKTIDNYLNNYYAFLKKIRYFYNRDIIGISLYPAYNISNNTIYEINKNLQKILGEVNGKFIDITALALNSNYYADLNSYYMNNLGHKAIYNLLVKTI